MADGFAQDFSDIVAGKKPAYDQTQADALASLNSGDYASDLANWRQQQSAKDRTLSGYQMAAQNAQDQYNQLQGRVGQIGTDYDKALQSGLAQTRRAALARIQGSIGALGAGQGGGIAMGQAAHDLGNQVSDITTQNQQAKDQAVFNAQQAANQAQTSANAANIAYNEAVLKRGSEQTDIAASQADAETTVRQALKNADHWYGLDRSDAAAEIRAQAAHETDPYKKRYLEEQAHKIVMGDRG